MPSAPILAGSHTTFIKIALMCRAFKQFQFLLKFKMKNKGNGKNIYFPSFHVLQDIFLQLLIYEIERKLVVLSESCTLAAPVLVFTIWARRTRLVCKVSSRPARSKECTSDI